MKLSARLSSGGLSSERSNDRIFVCMFLNNKTCVSHFLKISKIFELAHSYISNHILKMPYSRKSLTYFPLNDLKAKTAALYIIITEMKKFRALSY